ncbi:MAG: hypothetical protein ACQEQV_08300 [Fibrobacterota bacterium]
MTVLFKRVLPLLLILQGWVAAEEPVTIVLSLFNRLKDAEAHPVTIDSITVEHSESLRRTDAMLAEYRNRSALTLRGGYVQNLTGTELYAERTRAYTGLEYAFLKNGRGTFKEKRKQLTAQRRFDSLQTYGNLLQEQYDHLRLKIEHAAYTCLRKIREAHLEILQGYTAHLQQQNLWNQTDRSTVQRYREQQRGDSIFIANSRDIPSSSYTPGVYILDIQRIRSFLDSVPLASRSELLNAQKESFRSRARLNAQLQGSFEPADSLGERANLTAGIHFAMPLFTATSAEAHLLKDIRRNEEKEHRRRIQRKRDSIETRYLDYLSARNRIRRYESETAAHISRIRNLTAEGTKSQNRSYSSQIYQLSLKTLESLEDMLRTRLELNRSIIDILKTAEAKHPQEFISMPQKEDDILQSTQNHRAGRACYIWHSSLQNEPIADIIRVMTTWNIRRLYASGLNRISEEKQKELRASLQTQDIALIPLFSENTWIYPEKHDHALRSILQRADSAPALHLDIEPHALSGWREDNYAKLNDFSQLISHVRSSYAGELILSLPVIYPQRFYGRLSRISDRITLMAYGPTDTDKIRARITPLLGQMEKATVETALRCADYTDTEHLQTVAEGLENARMDVVFFDYASLKELQ